MRMHCALFTVDCVVYSVQCSLWTVCTVCTVHCVLKEERETVEW